MSTFDGDVYVVSATDGRETAYWAVAKPRYEAVQAVQDILPPGWTASFTEKRLTAAQISALRFGADGGIERLQYTP